MLIGTARQFPTESLVRIKLQALIHKINGQSFFLNDPMLLCNVLIERFIMEERLETIAKDRPTQSPDGLRYSTARGYYRLLNQYIRPRWGNVPVDQVRPALVQQWLDEMPRSPKSKANIKALMHRLIDRGIFWGMVDLQRNPMELIRVKGASKRLRRPSILSAEQFSVIIQKLRDPFRAMVILAQCLGLRVSELLALQWLDVDFGRQTLTVSRGIVEGRVGALKTECSQDELPLHPNVAEMLRRWKEVAPLSAEGWIFANRLTQKPYDPCSIRKRHLKPIGEELGIVNFGWHTFRHTYRSWLDATGAPVGVQQKLMRHAQVSTTMNIYGNALLESKREANGKVVELALQTVARAGQELGVT